MMTFDRRILGLSGLALGLMACIPLPNDLGGDGPPDEDQSTSSPLASTGAQDSMTSGPGTGGTSPGFMTTSTTEVPPTADAGDSESDTFEEPVTDVGRPQPGGPPCDEVGPSTVVVTSSSTAALGPLPVAHGVYGWDHCCVRRPRIVLTVDPPPATGQPWPAEYFASTISQGEFGVSLFEAEPHEGLFEDPSIEGLTGPDGTFELLEPIDSLYPEPPDPETRIHAHLTLRAPGWDIDVEVEAPYCSAYDRPKCPCE